MLAIQLQRYDNEQKRCKEVVPKEAAMGGMTPDCSPSCRETRYMQALQGAWKKIKALAMGRGSTRECSTWTKAIVKA